MKSLKTIIALLAFAAGIWLSASIWNADAQPIIQPPGSGGGYVETNTYAVEQGIQDAAISSVEASVSDLETDLTTVSNAAVSAGVATNVLDGAGSQVVQAPADITSGNLKLGDVDGVGNSTTLEWDDQNATVTFNISEVIATNIMNILLDNLRTYGDVVINAGTGSDTWSNRMANPAFASNLYIYGTLYMPNADAFASSVTVHEVSHVTNSFVYDTLAEISFNVGSSQIFTANTYEQITNLVTSVEDTSYTCANTGITVAAAGDYLIEWDISYQTGDESQVTGRVYSGDSAITDDGGEVVGFQRTQGAAASDGNAAASRVVTLAADDVISAYLSFGDAETSTWNNGSLRVTRIR